jgi:uncharacterized protein YaiI (UPF0178 family)
MPHLRSSWPDLFRPPTSFLVTAIGKRRRPQHTRLPIVTLISIYIDADACPVKQEIYRVAERHALKGTALKVLVVSNSPIAVPRDMVELIERVVVGAGMDEADNWIAERAGKGDIVVTADVPLASRCVKAGADVIAPNGRPFTEESIGMTLATRNLMDSLRSAGEITGGPKPFSPRDRSEFLSALDRAIVRLTRAGFGVL